MKGGPSLVFVLRSRNILIQNWQLFLDIYQFLVTYLILQTCNHFGEGPRYIHPIRHPHFLQCNSRGCYSSSSLMMSFHDFVYADITLETGVSLMFTSTSSEMYS